ncbi:MAG: hypothetical protein ACXWC7_16385, partial [Chitinophagaceae bacterium]
PKIREVLADQLVEPTVIKDGDTNLGEENTRSEEVNDKESPAAIEESMQEGTDDVMLSVTEDGELVDKIQGEDQD